MMPPPELLPTAAPALPAREAGARAFLATRATDRIRRMPKRIGVLASGGGSNLQALYDHLAALGERRAGEIALVVSDRASTGALQRATAWGVSTLVVPPASPGPALLELLRRHEIDLVVLAGYLKLVPSEVVGAYRGRIVNVHPALLPAFGGPGMYGGRVHAAVIAQGARVSGVTVHFVDEVYDRGPIVAQWPVPVLGDDTAETLARRVLAVEHLLYPRVVQALAAGTIRLGADNRALVPLPSAASLHYALTSDPGALAAAIDRLWAAGESPLREASPFFPHP